MIRHPRPFYTFFHVSRNLCLVAWIIKIKNPSSNLVQPSSLIFNFCSHWTCRLQRYTMQALIFQATVRLVIDVVGAQALRSLFSQRACPVVHFIKLMLSNAAPTFEPTFRFFSGRVLLLFPQQIQLLFSVCFTNFLFCYKV